MKKYISVQGLLVLALSSLLCGAFQGGARAEEALSAERIQNTVVLDEMAVKNLRLKTETADYRPFETTVFAVGRLEENPARRYSVSSRISGRALDVFAFAGDRVEAGETLVRVESRQPGNPPPTIELKAVADGLVVESHVLKGQPVEPATDLLDISDRSEMWAVAQIPEREAVNIRPGTRARIVIPALGGEVIEAELLRYGVTADREAGTVEGVFQIPNPDGRMLPGMRVEFSIIIDHRDSVLSVSRKAVQGDPARRVMFVKDFELPHAFIRVPVVLGEENDQYVEVLEGLFPGDEVVTQGAYMLGFVGGGSGLSLKEALDAAHGHEHNEDGSEITPEQRAGGHSGEDEMHGHHSESHSWLKPYAIGVTVLLLFFVASSLQRKRRGR